MDRATTGFLLIMACAVAYERVLELMRSFMDWVRPRSGWLARQIDTLTRGGWALLPAIGLSIAAGANLFDVFRVVHDEPAFVKTFFTWPSAGDVPRWLGGCSLMGFAISFGSAIWHDLAKALL